MRSAGKACLISLFVVVIVSKARADEWKLSGAFNQSIEYDDNINMSVDGAEVFGYLMRPSFVADWATPYSELALSGSADIRRYDDERWNCENFSLGLNQNYMRKRSVFSLPFQYAQSCSYSQQITDTGILVPNNNSETLSLSPTWSWEWTASDQLTLGFSYSQTSYTSVGSSNSGQMAANFSNNDSYSLNLSEQHTWTRRFSSTISLFASRSEFDNAIRSSSQNVFGFQLGARYAITRSWSVNGGGGFRWVQRPSIQTELSGTDNDSMLRTEVANFALNYKGRQTDFSVNFARTVSPSSFGQLLEYNSLSMAFSQNINRKLSFNFKASVYQNEAVGQSQFQSANKRTYYSLSPGLVWDFARHWQMTATYRYRRQEYSTGSDGEVFGSLNDPRDSNAFILHINYNWDGFRVANSKPIY